MRISTIYRADEAYLEVSIALIADLRLRKAFATGPDDVSPRMLEGTSRRMTRSRKDGNRFDILLTC
jgi:hypothetical protein